MQQHVDLMEEDRPGLRGAAWAVLNGVQLGFTLVWTAAWISAALVLIALTRRRDLALWMAAHCWAPALFAAGRVRFEVDGADRVDWSRTYLVVANHQSVMDVCALFRAVPQPLRFLLKQEVRRMPFVGWYASACEMLFIMRDARRAGPQLRRDAAAMLRRRRSLCLFPEGTRTRTGRMAPFKAGSFQAAIDAGVDVLPVAIHGAGAVLPVQGVFRARPGTIRVCIGRPITSTGTDRQALAERAQGDILAMLQQG